MPADASVASWLAEVEAADRDLASSNGRGRARAASRKA
jgi:hypothetical protein